MYICQSAESVDSSHEPLRKSESFLRRIVKCLTSNSTDLLIIIKALTHLYKFFILSSGQKCP